MYTIVVAYFEKCRSLISGLAGIAADATNTNSSLSLQCQQQKAVMRAQTQYTCHSS
jgi:hypothetical protein